MMGLAASTAPCVDEPGACMPGSRVQPHRGPTAPQHRIGSRLHTCCMAWRGMHAAWLQPRAFVSIRGHGLWSACLPAAWASEQSGQLCRQLGVWQGSMQCSAVSLNQAGTCRHEGALAGMWAPGRTGSDHHQRLLCALHRVQCGVESSPRRTVSLGPCCTPHMAMHSLLGSRIVT